MKHNISADDKSLVKTQSEAGSTQVFEEDLEDTKSKKFSAAFFF